MTITRFNQSIDADELLASRCQLGEKEAFDDLIKQWAQPLYRYVLRVTGNPDAAADISQDVWIAVVRGIAGLRNCRTLRSWLFGIAHRILMNRFRMEYAIQLDHDIDLDKLVAEELDSEKESMLHAMDRELSAMPIVEREILTLFYLQELSLADISNTLGIPEGTVKSRLFRARNMLRSQLIKED